MPPCLGKNECRLADGKAIVAGKHEVHCPPVSAHPFRGKGCRITWTDVPIVGVEHDRPWPPRPWRFVNGQPAVKAEIHLPAGVVGAFVWPRVDEQKTIQC